VHGSIEYALRYEHFAKVLNSKGYSVYAMDIRGHGETGKRSRFGYFGDHDGYQLV
jgi:alpha-beta hydrolase superfamily lysophospholipase